MYESSIVPILNILFYGCKIKEKKYRKKSDWIESGEKLGAQIVKSLTI